uniref:Kunitz/Bovine pancreatic trypsin inhibitor domain protein n=1 Tax=Parastrongyloides trichosuri TaxID=131310 RepID=A0A0N4ZK37_PARTI
MTNIKIIPNNVKITTNLKPYTRAPNIELVTPVSTQKALNFSTTRITAETQAPYSPQTIKQIISSTTSSVISTTLTPIPTTIELTNAPTISVPITTTLKTTPKLETTTEILTTSIPSTSTVQTTTEVKFVTPITMTPSYETTEGKPSENISTVEAELSSTLTEEDLKATTTFYRRPNRKSTTVKNIPPIPETTTKEILETTTEKILETVTEEVLETTTEKVLEVTTEKLEETTTSEQLPETTTTEQLAETTTTEKLVETTTTERLVETTTTEKPTEATTYKITELETTIELTTEPTIEATTSYISSKINPCPNGIPYASTNNSTFSTCSYLLPENGGCPDEYFCHTGATFSTTTCCPLPTPDTNICDLPRTSGDGENFLSRWYYDKLSHSCKRFIFKGLRGNGNNFMSQYDCRISCVLPHTPKPIERVNPCSFKEPAINGNDSSSYIKCSSPSDLKCPVNYYCQIGSTQETSVCCPRLEEEKCDQPLLYGEGDNVLERYFYNKNNDKCEKFIFNGLKSNENNFLSLSECERICKPWKSPCPGSESTKPPRKNCDLCTSDEWCHIGDTPKNTVCCPNPVEDVCSQSMEVGNGNGNVTRWYSDLSGPSCGKKCKPFYYSGSGGTQNNFLTQEECEATCHKECPNPCSSGDLLLNVTGNSRQCNQASPCPSGYWCHVGDKQETTVCCSTVPNACELPLNVGIGESRLKRFYYDSLLKACIPFNYKGMGGNQNMYLTEEDCKVICPVYENPCAIDSPLLTSSKKPKICSPTSRCPSTHFCHIGPDSSDNYCCRKNGNPCEQELQEGLGNYSLSRFYYDIMTKTCKPFIYLGSKGNANNFLTKKDCEIVCPVTLNPCNIGSPLTDPNGDSVICGGDGTCPSDYYCHIGAAPDTTNCCPIVQGNVCKMALLHGEGNDKLNRWYYNSTSQQCVQFVYNGLQGNPNNFLTLEDCTKSCQSSNPCLNGQPLLSSSNKRITCSSYNGIDTCPSSHFCHLGGTSSDTVCCPRMTQDPCEQPLNEGEGGRMLNRWYFDTGLNKCLPFIYAGVMGNENNFPTKDQCDIACPEYKYYCPHGLPILSSDNGNVPLTCSVDKACPDGSICHMSIEFNTAICCEDPLYFCNEGRDHGPCDGNEIRYGYNPETDTCVEYEYGGCGGSLNNFVSLQRCTEVCCKDTQ